jgi:N,N-dimethylformamidase
MLKITELKITGYSDRIYARPGETIKFMVSCEGLKSYRADIVRLIHGDTNPAGPGFKERVVKTPVSRRYQGRKQVIHAGSHALVPNALEALQSFTVQAMIWPTTPGKGGQGIVSRYSAREGAGFALEIDETGAAALRLGAGSRKAVVVSTGRKLLERRWYFVAASFDAKTRRASVTQEPLVPVPGIRDGGSASRTVTGARTAAPGHPLMIAGIERGVSKGRVLVGSHYNGKIDSPRLASRVLTRAEMEALKEDVPSQLEDAIVGAWDFSADIPSDRITDLSPNRLDGKVVNLPARAMTGWNWTGEIMDWRADPRQWGAIHFHDDDVYDAGWEADFELTVPERMKSGLYAARIRSSSHEEYIPFAVGPKPGKEAKLALLLPTGSYMAYANHHMGVDGAGTELQNGCLALLYPQDLFLNEHREYGRALYDVHSDGSGVCYSSRLRPILNMRPKYQSILGGFAGSSLWQFNADTHITDWLEAKGHEYDVITDEELHDRGLELLSPYRVVMTGSHPEYWSTDMWDAMDAYKGRGGRLIYMGGNGFYWRIAYHAELPGVIEVRRNENGIRSWPAQPGEYYHSFTGEYGGLWLYQGRPPQAAVGTGFSAQGFDVSSYYRRKPDSFKAKVAFVFKGVGKDEKIGDFGLIGGAAAGLELDRAEPALGTPPNSYLLATSEDHTDIYLLVPEEFLETEPGFGGQECPRVRADMVFFETPNGGAVFSTSSIAWAGSLSHNDYRNNVSRITNNVLKRFLDSRPF